MKYNNSILFIILISTIKEVSASSDWNIGNLLQQYFTLCGPNHFCFMHDFVWTTHADNIKHNCPPCSCGKKCWEDRNCCPDLYFSHPEPVCKSAAILNESLTYEQSSTFLMIDSCPKSTDEEIKRNCEGESSYTEKILYPPVTSQNSSLAYLNRYCADCNHDFNYDPWPLDIVCDKFLDINFISSYAELIGKGKENRCNILSYPPHEEINYRCRQDVQERVNFDSCNKIGSWKTFDYNIQQACESRYINKDKMFKNMFCKICNPPIYTENVIGRCNVTGMWDEYNPTHEKACLNNDFNPGSLPYKNVFCFSCNKPARLNSNFLDVNAKIKSKINDIQNTGDIKSFYFDISVLNFDEDFFETKLNGEQSDYKKRPNDVIIQSPNITNLLFKRMSLDGNMNTCGNYSIPSLFSIFESNCSCDPKCIFTDGLYGSQRCCSDIPLRYPSVCLSEKKLSMKEAQRNAEELLVTSGCYGTKEFPEFIKRGCHEQFEDAFSLHPVTDLSTDIPYLNMYCLQCSKSPSTKLVIHKPWDITANCSVYIDYPNFLLFSNFLKALRSAGCETYYHPPNSVTSCQYSKGKTCFRKSDSIIDKCNKTGHWPYKDPDIHWACEFMPAGSLPLWRDNNNDQMTTYKNIYCALCNPPEWSNPFVENCSSDVSTISMQKCNFFPKIYFLYPYKNIFCDFCTNEFLRTKTISNNVCYNNDHQYPLSFETKDHILSQYFSPYRSVMKSSNYLYKYPNDNFRAEVIGEPRCMEAQKFYSMMGGCRNITCYPGKTLNLGKSCLPLFRKARNLRYHMNAYFNCSIQFNTSTGDTLYNVLQFPFYKLGSLFGQRSLRKLITEIDIPCQGNILLENYFQLHLSFILFFENPVPRLQRELDLLNIKYNFSIPGITMISIAPPAESNWSCSFIYDDNSDDWTKYRDVRVSNLLVCTQIELSRQEFEIYKTGENTVMLIKMYNITIDWEDFDILPDGTARVCVSALHQNQKRTTYEIYFKKRQQGSIVFAFLVLSCIFLFITFCTYCIFHELRTLPGGTIMILIAVLFTTFAFILNGSGGEVNTRRCVVFGIITHYLWLTSFFSMNICSFHLYRVFHSKFPLHNQNNKWCILGKYSVYIFVIPLVIVSTNITVMIMTKHDIGYGKVKCFIHESLHLIVFFLIPVGLLCTVNLFFFIKTLSTIIRSPKIRKNKAKTNEFSIFARLFTITGATWLLQIMGDFVENTEVSFVFSAINSLQGVFIFIAFMCSRRTLKLYQRLIFRRRKREGSATSVTRSTQKTFTESETSA